jgi:hypothetical protein
MSLLLALFPYPYFRDGRFAPEPAEEATRRFDHFHHDAAWPRMCLQCLMQPIVGITDGPGAGSGHKGAPPPGRDTPGTRRNSRTLISASDLA